MVGKPPKWETELWSYLSSGDGEHCPVYSHCHLRQRGGWCPDDNKEHIERLLDDQQCSLSNCDFIGCKECSGCGEYGGIFKMVERLAQVCVRMGEVRCPPVPTVLAALAAQQRAIEVRIVPLTTYHAAVWCLKGSWIVHLNESDTPAGRRFSLFHEAFHILAHCKTIPVFRKRGTTQGSFNEGLATHFAACILMPRQWLKEKWAEVEDLDRMARIFDVPESAMCVRLRRLGLI